MIEILSSHSLASKLFTPRETSVNRVLKHVTPVIEERRRNMEIHGEDWADKPVRTLIGLHAICLKPTAS
jgi:hypothetical protein